MGVAARPAAGDAPFAAMDSCGESTLRRASRGGETLSAVELPPEQGLCRCAWCEAVLCEGGWRPMTTARRVFQSVAGRPVGDTADAWVICPSCLARDFGDVNVRLGFAA